MLLFDLQEPPFSVKAALIRNHPVNCQELLMHISPTRLYRITLRMRIAVATGKAADKPFYGDAVIDIFLDSGGTASCRDTAGTTAPAGPRHV
jgi:hypothetical protein